MQSRVLLLLLSLMVSDRADDQHSTAFGYKIIPGVGVYKVHREVACWKNAWRACSEEDAHLLILDSPEEAEAVRGILKEARLQNYRDTYLTDTNFYVSVGFHCLFSDRFWTTVFGEPLDQVYHAWGRNRPLGPMGGVLQCGAVNLNMEIADIPCEGQEFPFVCEKL